MLFPLRPLASLVKPCVLSALARGILLLFHPECGCTQELVREVATSCSAAASGTPSGTAVTEGGVSAPLREILALEAQASERCARQIEDLTKGEAGSDIFGNHAKQIVDTLTCTNCGTQIASNRFAPHLERCMLGKGRASARVARDMMRSTAESDTRLAY